MVAMHVDFGCDEVLRPRTVDEDEIACPCRLKPEQVETLVALTTEKAPSES
jgi:hypothetical protein